MLLNGPANHSWITVKLIWAQYVKWYYILMFTRVLRISSRIFSIETCSTWFSRRFFKFTPMKQNIRCEQFCHYLNTNSICGAILFMSITTSISIYHLDHQVIRVLAANIDTHTLQEDMYDHYNTNTYIYISIYKSHATYQRVILLCFQHTPTNAGIYLHITDFANIQIVERCINYSLLLILLLAVSYALNCQLRWN